MPKLRYLLLDGNAAIHSSGLPTLKNCRANVTAQSILLAIGYNMNKLHHKIQ